MYLAYFDESGDPGLVNSPTDFYVLACLLVHESAWLETLNNLVDMRRWLRDNHGIPSRAEVKASDIKRGRGPFFGMGLSKSQRFAIFRDLLAFENQMAVRKFAIAIEKNAANARGRQDSREAAWTFAIQRVHRFCIEKDERAMLFPDEGNPEFIRKRVRGMRRFHYVPMRWGSGSFAIPADRIVEDPSHRKSHESYFVQLADWNAFSAHRSTYVDPLPGTPDDLWDHIPDIHLLAVNRVRGGPPGIVKYP